VSSCLNGGRGERASSSSCREDFTPGGKGILGEARSMASLLSSCNTGIGILGEAGSLASLLSSCNTSPGAGS
jgi:predicted small secreted protein